MAKALVTFTWERPVEDWESVILYCIMLESIGLHWHPATDPDFSWTVTLERGRKYHAEIWCKFLNMSSNGKHIAYEFEVPAGENQVGPDFVNMTLAAANVVELYNEQVNWTNFEDLWRASGRSALSFEVATWIQTLVIITSPSLGAPIHYFAPADYDNSHVFSLPEGIKIHIEYTHTYSYFGQTLVLRGEGQDQDVGRQGVPTNFNVSIAGVCTTGFIAMHFTGFTPQEEFDATAVPPVIRCNRVAGTNSYYGVGGTGSVTIDEEIYNGVWIAYAFCESGLYWGYTFLRITPPGPPKQIQFVMAGYIPSLDAMAVGASAESSLVGAGDWPGPNNGNVNNVLTSAWEAGNIVFR